ncbi:accessory Sec system protein Asp3 [Lactococcus sp. DD01]|uniref:accessory Sec system protein Asp3 n=1 Tax=Lactococcus sp. DD01 TaxID=1776443 RepID=UPI0007769DE8|nr:accessory Sec system protein Asp3 [Lactococcus sp. DD01]
MDFDIVWNTSQINFYKYGAKIVYRSDHTVYFTNNFFPSGATIVKWTSNSLYQGERTLLQLPLLKRGKHYELITDFTCEPQDSVLIKMEFYERSGKLMETCVFEGKGGDVTYPMGAYFYSISLINMGMRELLFKKIKIIHASKDTETV